MADIAHMLVGVFFPNILTFLNIWVHIQQMHRVFVDVKCKTNQEVVGAKMISSWQLGNVKGMLLKLLNNSATQRKLNDF